MEEYSITKEFMALPSSDSIHELIDQDADKLANEIKEKFMAEVSTNRGLSHVMTKVPDLYRDKVTSKLSKWAKLYGYKFEVDGNVFSIMLKGLKYKPKSLCSKCEKERKTIRHAMAPLVVISFIAMLNITTFLIVPRLCASTGSMSVLFLVVYMLYYFISRSKQDIR